MEKLQQKLVSMEDRSRRNNLRIINLKEGVEDQALAYLMRSLLKWFPELHSSPPELTRVHRIGPLRKTPAPPRTMILNCLRFTDRDRILGFARKSPVTVEGQIIRFAADYSDATARRRRPCFPIMNRARSLGFQAFLLYPAIIKLTRGFDQNLFTEPKPTVNPQPSDSSFTFRQVSSADVQRAISKISSSSGPGPDSIEALRSNPSHLRELSLYKNKLGDSGVKQLSDLLANPHCKLETLRLSECGVTDEGCVALASALRSNPSHLRKLDLSFNKLGDSGVKQLEDLRDDPHYKLETLG
ncbi:NACHT, LRR and PYD domains-containing protein [Pimephales promelas]|nr:NACHT, LRR and PYD domains-containing protein [Pimephales promelas]